MLPDQQELDNQDFSESPEEEKKIDWGKRAAQAFEISTDYYESSLDQTWKDNLAHANSEHPSGSKYTSNNYKQRSKLFRPKTKSFLRQSGATVASALFSNQDVINVAGADKNSDLHADAAKLVKALTQHRLEHDIPWYTTVLGANYDIDIYGICISKTYWDFKARAPEPEYELALDDMGSPIFDEEGNPLGYEIEQDDIIDSDKPVIELLPPDNFRFDPNADWRDPVSSSPYLIEMMPMYAIDVQDMMKSTNTGEQISWNEFTLEEIITKGSKDTQEKSSVHSERNKKREDPQGIDQTQKEYKLVWVHFNILKDDNGQDIAFYTLGPKTLLSEPVPLKEIFVHERELYRVGFKNIETHKIVPESGTGMLSPIQTELNDITNQRHDNVKLVLNKRYALRRGAKIDTAALMRNVPGGGVMMDDPNLDYKIMETPDVTSSSYAEQDRLSVEADELVGSFSQSSVQSNRSLNETVGGMSMMSAAAGQVNEMDVRTFIETWVEPSLRTVVKLIKEYETDERIIALAQKNAGVLREIDESLFMQDLAVTVNVGMGNTNPMQRVERLMMPLNTVMQFPTIAQRIDEEEIAKELFSIAGQGDGDRFIISEEELKEKMANMPQPEPDQSLEIAQMNNEVKLQVEQMQQQGRYEIEMARLALQENMKVSEIRARLGIEQIKDKSKRDSDALKGKLEINKQNMQQYNQQVLRRDTF